MILIPEQVRSLRSEILRLEMKKKEYELEFHNLYSTLAGKKASIYH